MKRLMYLCMLVSVLAACKKNELPERNDSESVRKCAGCKRTERSHVNMDTVYVKGR